MTLSVCFLLPELGPSGGVRTVVEHARLLAADHGMDVELLVERPGGEPPANIPCRGVEEAVGRHFDVAVATWWETVFPLFRLDAHRRAYFVQNFEERLYRPGQAERLGARLTHHLPLAFVTEAAWIAGLLAELRPDCPCYHVPNGIDKRLFAPPSEPLPSTNGRLRLLVEGSPRLWFKGVDEAAAAAAAMRQSRALTLVTPDGERHPGFERVLGPVPHADMPAIYRETDVVLKLSRVEGVFTPPLEGFHCGATCVVWPVSGHDEYVRHGVNGIVAGWDDIVGTARWLDLIARRRELLDRLRTGALETARRWPSTADSSALLASALRDIAAGPEPPTDTSGLLNTLSAGLADMRRAGAGLAADAEVALRAAEERGRRAAAAERRVHELELELASRLGARARRLLASLRR